MKLKELLEWNLFLDDERNPKEEKNFKIARSYDEAIELIKKHGFPKYMSLDHDLGEGKTGHDFAKWITKEYQDKELPEFEFNVHSANPVGKENIEKLLLNFIKFKKDN